MFDLQQPAAIMNPIDPTNIVCNVLDGLSSFNPCKGVSTEGFIKAYLPQNASFCSASTILQSLCVAYSFNCNRPSFIPSTLPSFTPPPITCYTCVGGITQLGEIPEPSLFLTPAPSNHDVKSYTTMLRGKFESHIVR